MLAIACTPTLEKMWGLSSRFEVPSELRSLGLAGVGASFLLIALGGFRLGKYARIFPEPAKNAPLRITGAFAFCRHPMYSGFLMGGIFWTLYLGSRLSLYFTIALFVVLLIKVRIEERYLKKIYGSAFDEYKKKTGMFFPRFPKKDCCG